MKATISLSIVADVNVKGETLEEALLHAQELKLSDVISVKGEHIDSSKLIVRSVWDEDDWLDNRE